MSGRRPQEKLVCPVLEDEGPWRCFHCKVCSMRSNTSTNSEIYYTMALKFNDQARKRIETLSIGNSLSETLLKSALLQIETRSLAVCWPLVVVSTVRQWLTRNDQPELENPSEDQSDLVFRTIRLWSATSSSNSELKILWIFSLKSSAATSQNFWLRSSELSRNYKSKKSLKSVHSFLVFKTESASPAEKARSPLINLQSRSLPVFNLNSN